MFGHGTGTLSILAGKDIDGQSLGAAGNLDIVPVRVANWVVLFSNSAIARAFDYVHSLCDDEATRIHVVTMSMGGIASAAWADAVNALYERGVFVVTAAGNNFGNLPTRFTVYPARFNRVVAACGVMADGRPYADLPIRKMAGCYGPPSKDATSIAAYTPNVPWAKFGCPDDDRHGWRRHLGRDAAGRRGGRPVDAEEQGGARTPTARTGCGSRRPARPSSTALKAPTPISRAMSAADCCDANAALDLAPAAAAALQEQQDARRFRVLPASQGADRARPDARVRPTGSTCSSWKRCRSASSRTTSKAC